MSPYNSNHNENKSTPPNSPSAQLDRRERLQRELKMVEGFVTVFQNKLDQIRLRGNSEGAFKLEDEERKILMAVNNSGLWTGVAAGLVMFVALRRIRAGFLRRFQQQHQSHPLGKTSETHVQNSPFGMTPPSPSPWPPDYAQSLNKRAEFFSMSNLFGLVVDGLIGFMTAASSSLYFSDPRKIGQSLAGLPLIPGRSRVADEFCPDVLAEWKRLAVESGMSEELQQRPLQLESPYLAALLEFKDNCTRRQALERRLRLEQGLAADTPVAIPAPGVPVDDPALLPLESDDNTDNLDNDFLFYEPDTSSSSRNPDYMDDDWADSLTTDREDDDRRRR